MVRLGVDQVVDKDTSVNIEVVGNGIEKGVLNGGHDYASSPSSSKMSHVFTGAFSLMTPASARRLSTLESGRGACRYASDFGAARMTSSATLSHDLRESWSLNACAIMTLIRHSTRGVEGTKVDYGIAA